MRRPFVSLLTDFGVRDASAAICRGVILGICPDVEILDITHDVRKFSIRDAALALWCALPYLPVGVHVGVVDPGVGTARRPVAMRVARGDVLVGPDNGLLMAAAERLGGIGEVRELAEPAYRLSVVTSSFHGRDIFAPAAAHLAAGVAFASLGPPLDAASLVPSPLPAPRHLPDGGLLTEIIYVDTFGNVKLSAMASDLDAVTGATRGRGRAVARPRLAVALDDGRTLHLPWAATFGEVPHGESLLYADSYDRLCIAVNRGNAAAQLGLADGAGMEIRAT
jgi:S-adenosyl-L-methionine hydrolase (adenosine-forming)